MCKKLDWRKQHLTIDLNNKHCQVVQIHNDFLGKFIILAKFTTKKNVIKKIVFYLVSQEKELFLNFEDNLEFKNNTFYFTLRPFSSRLKFPRKVKYNKDIIIPKSGLMIENNIQFRINGKKRDRLNGDTGFGDQACRYKIM